MSNKNAISAIEDVGISPPLNLRFLPAIISCPEFYFTTLES